MRKLVGVLLLAVVTCIVITGCPPKQTTQPPVSPAVPTTSEAEKTPATSTLSGSIRISGAWALYPMVVKWGELYQQANPAVKMDISAGGAGKGAADALGGLVEIGMVSRSIHQDEIDKGGWFVPVCIDAVFPTINEKNPAIADLVKTGVKAETLADIWITSETTKWGQVAGKTGGDAIHVYTRSDACGAAETWAKFLDKEKKQEDLKGTGVYGDPGLAEAVIKDPLAIGFNNLNYAYDTKTGQPLAGLRILPIDKNGNGKLDPEESFYGNRDEVTKAIQAGKYPSPPSRKLNFLCKGAPTGATAEFIKWVLTDGQAECLPNGYIPLTDDDDAEALKKLG
ncbi:MAG: PstS family phosphate ABC transporter substrate-binding protein [Armatimonadetes bacterium]|nr:PstS family phosphate ABC transporter substrate-binding protein [Armatimonadota bacterium]